MKSITIHNLDDTLEERIKERARKHGTSLNKTIQMLLKESLGLNKKPQQDHKSDFLDLFGIWTEKDAEDFNRQTSSFRLVDKQDWE
jgi:plasmid stability protein